MKKFILLSLLLVGCARDPLSTYRSNNPEFNPSLLFEHNGVKVYRFVDAGRYVYYTDARGHTSYIVSEGKTTRVEAVETAE